uniref:Uncharacterized protein GUT15 n=1 Tax=Nicotiana tabacum TaxID=4097 RepID=O24158_TOBAC|nr:unknown [Nicotiana tabacum]
MMGALAWQVTIPNKVSIFCFGRGDGTGILPGAPLFVSSRLLFSSLFPRYYTQDQYHQERHIRLLDTCPLNGGLLFKGK